VTYFVLVLGVCFVLGGLAVGSKLSPYYGVVGIGLALIAGCGWLASLGFSFVALVLFVVYLEGMLVGFVYSVPLSTNPFPETGG
ncbi:NU6M oxidoreductase, partial [Rhinopomastus cyanomelas]|nr:NU6M oxidoreductase [Rhinopomastus cyanomelas]